MSKSKAWSTAVNLSSAIQLNDGVFMPLFGLGTFRAEQGKITEDAVTYALQNGYRMLDTAQFYGNEADVARGVRKSGLRREDVFVVTKVWTNNHGYDATTASVMESLSKMEEKSVDMFLIHSPSGGKNVETYKALLDLKAKGHIRSVGVSNFGIQHLKGLEAAGLPAPSVNQIELHPFMRRNELVEYCRAKNIGVMGYCPLVRGMKDDDKDLISMAQKHKRTLQQVLIRWGVQKGYITIPKSTKQERINANAQVFDFELRDEDMQILENKPDNFCCSWDPTTSPWVD